MSYNYPLKYRTMDQMLDEVKLDFYMYDTENLIRPEQLIKAIKSVNYDLGLRIHSTQEDILEIERGMCKLPDDFYILNYALLCDQLEITTALPQGTHIEERYITDYHTAPPETDVCDPPQIDCRTTVQGCGCRPCECGSNTCGGCSNCSSLCPQCATENALCNTTTTTITEEVTPGNPPIGGIHLCGWQGPENYFTNPGSLTVIIDGSNHTITYADHNEMEGNLNALGLGYFQVEPNINGTGYITVVGDHEYGNLSMEIGGDPYYTKLECNTAIFDNSVDGSVCAWFFPNYYLENQVGIQFVVYINGTPYYSNAWASYIYSNIELWIADLNTLGLGTFTAVESVAGNLLIYVNGSETYGEMWYYASDPRTAQPARCELVTGAVTVPVTTIEQECFAKLPSCRPRIEMNCKGETYELVQVVNPGITHTYKITLPLKILENAENVECGCPNLYMNTPNTGWIENGFLKTNFQTGKVYINYQGKMEDKEGNLLVPDHDGLNDYYEYKVKSRILENLAMNNEPVGKKIDIMELRVKQARLYALTIVNTPNFAEMKRIWWSNRKAQYARYYNMFKSYPGYLLNNQIRLNAPNNQR